MGARVTIRIPDGRTVSLAHGDLIGRLATAALVLDDPRVSEAHAMVSLRGDGLYLLGLRRPVRVGGTTQTSVRLAAGQQVDFADDLTLEVVSIELPESVPAIESSDMARQALPSVCSLYSRPRSRLSGKFDPEAPAHLWSLEDVWRLRIGNSSRTLDIGDSFELDGKWYSIVSLDLHTVAGDHTVQSGGINAPLRLITRYDTAQIHREARPTVLLTGGSARILSELAAVGCGMRWEELCRVLWSKSEDPPQKLRHRLDMAMLRLRRRLKAERVREDLVQAGGAGLIELVLHPGDELVDES